MAQRSRRERLLLGAVWTLLGLAVACLLVLSLIPSGPHSHDRALTLSLLAVMFSSLGLAGVACVTGFVLYG